MAKRRWCGECRHVRKAHKGQWNAECMARARTEHNVLTGDEKKRLGMCCIYNADGKCAKWEER